MDKAQLKDDMKEMCMASYDQGRKDMRDSLVAAFKRIDQTLLDETTICFCIAAMEEVKIERTLNA